MSAALNTRKRKKAEAPAVQLSLIPEMLAELTVADIALTALPPNEAIVGPDPTREFVSSVAKYGILQSIVLEQKTDGTYRIAAGRRRIKAARAAGRETIPARVFPAGWVDPSAVALVENQMRSSNDAAMLEALIELGNGRSDEDLLTIPGLDKTTLKKVRRLLGLMPDLLAAVTAGRISTAIGYAMCDLEPSRQGSLLRVYNANGKLKAADVYAASRAQAQEGVNELQADLFDTPDGIDGGGTSAPLVRAPEPEPEVHWHQAVQHSIVRSVREAPSPAAGLLTIIEGYLMQANAVLSTPDLANRVLWEKVRRAAVTSRAHLITITETEADRS